MTESKIDEIPMPSREFTKGELLSLQSILDEPKIAEAINPENLTVLTDKIELIKDFERWFFEESIQDSYGGVASDQTRDSYLNDFFQNIARTKRTLNNIKKRFSHDSSGLRQANSSMYKKMESLQDKQGNIIKDSLGKCESLENEINREMESYTFLRSRWSVVMNWLTAKVRTLR